MAHLPADGRGGPACPPTPPTAAFGTGSPVPPAAPSSPAASPTGRLRLRAARVGGRTGLVDVERTAPFHPGPPAYRGEDGAAEVIVQHAGPGLFPGETLEATIEVDRGAALVVRGQGATKVYPSPSGAAAVSRSRLRVAAGAALRWLPGELIPFRDAVLRQETVVALAPGARLALLEILTPGRLAMGERDAYARLDLRLRIEVAGRPVLIERAVLEPAHRPLAAPARHGGFPCVGALYLAGFGLEEASALGQSEPDDAVWWGSGATAAADVTVVRLLGPTAQAVRAEAEALLRRLDRSPIAVVPSD